MTDSEADKLLEKAISKLTKQPMTNHPVTPPPEMVEQWLAEGHHQDYCSATEHAIAQAARWGADQELEACCEYLSRTVTTFSAGAHLEAQRRSDNLRAARRPKPLSLKEQALGLIDSNSPYLDDDAMSIIRRALESLPE